MIADKVPVLIGASMFKHSNIAIQFFGSQDLYPAFHRFQAMCLGLAGN